MENRGLLSKPKRHFLLALCIIADLSLYAVSTVGFVIEAAIATLSKVILLLPFLGKALSFFLSLSEGSISVGFLFAGVTVSLAFWFILTLFVLISINDSPDKRKILRILSTRGLFKLIPIVNLLPLWTLAGIRILKKDL